METSHSLLVRLRDPADADAWYQFAAVYRPVILRMALARGLQHTDAEDLAQKVLVSVANSIERWEPSGRARFRTWLKRVIDNAVLNALTRTRPDTASAGDQVHELLSRLPDHRGPDSELLRMEYRREVLQWAARRIRCEFTETTWQAFWLTAVQSRPAEEVGRLLGRTRGGVYAARSRVMRRLMQEIAEFEEAEDQE